jgi:sugar phosphate isomerase/epimerase
VDAQVKCWSRALIHSGLVSVTFRTLPSAEVIRIAASANVDGIEWSGDTHVPAGKLTTARNVGNATRESGLKIAAYGSYYRVGYETPALPFDAVLETAIALGAPGIRVFAGDTGAKVAREHIRRRVATESQRIADKAASRGIGICFEYQANTLNDSPKASLELLEAIDRENVFTYWQPDARLLHDEQLQGLEEIVDHVSNVHVFHWAKGKRLALGEGEKDWRHYLSKLWRTKRDHFALIEFVQDDLPSKFERDAKTLLEILGTLPHRKD